MEQGIEEQYAILRRRYESLMEALNAKQREVEILMGEIELRNTKLLYAQQALDINKEIMRNALREQNETKDSMAGEIFILREELRKVTHGNHDRLGQ